MKMEKLVESPEMQVEESKGWQMPTLDINGICRLCLSKEDNMIDIFKEVSNDIPLPLRIMACTPIEIKNRDDLPCHVCGICHKLIESWYKFKDLCENSDRVLHQISDGEAASFEEIYDIQTKGKEIKSILRIDMETDKHKKEPPEVTENTVRFFECGICSKHFSEKSLALHLKQGHKKGKRKKKKESSKLLTLIKIIDGKKEPEMEMDTCHICGAEFITEHELVQHVAAEHGIVRDDPDNGEKPGMHKQEIFLHLNEPKDDPEDFLEQECPECSLPFPSESELLLHRFTDHRKRRKKEPNPSSSCPDCDRKFLSTKELYAHMRKQHSFRCPDCNWGFETEDDLKTHQMTMGDHKQHFICSDCGMYFKEETELKEHMRQKLQCNVCNKVFSRAQRLMEHKFVKHKIGERKLYQCETCGKSFPYATSLRYHKRIHGTKDIFCGICGKAFYFLCNYNVHMDLHHSTDQDKVICEHCGGLFPKCKMKDHLARHSQPSLPCEQCGKMFRLKNQLKRHKLQLHKDSSAFSCVLCYKAFPKADYLQNHLVTDHGEEYTILTADA